MSDLEDQQLAIAKALGKQLPTDVYALWPDIWDYALLVLATHTPLSRAITYLKDTGSPAHARGRLLLRAAERALRESGEVGGQED